MYDDYSLTSKNQKKPFDPIDLGTNGPCCYPNSN